LSGNDVEAGKISKVDFRDPEDFTLKSKSIVSRKVAKGK
jgi:hypothetical protein